MRLDRYLAEGLGITRSQAKDLLSHGRVRIGNTVCKKGDVQVDETSEVFVGGEPLAGAQKFVYIMLNKPQGVVSAREDKRDVTVTDLVAEDFPRRELFPAGRLDKSSTGFVLLTDDGALAHDLLSPRHHVTKTYAVLLDTPLTEEMQKGFEAGVTLADGTALRPAGLQAAHAGIQVCPALAARVEGAESGQPVCAPDPRLALVELRQGVYHQIKRMFGVYGAGVDGLHRLAIGPVALDETLAPGQWRELTAEEISMLKKAHR